LQDPRPGERPTAAREKVNAIALLGGIAQILSSVVAVVVVLRR